MRLSLCFLLFGCATTPNTFTIDADSKLQIYVNSFFIDCRKYLDADSCAPKINLKLKITNNLPERVLGQCTEYLNGLHLVQVLPTVVSGYDSWSVVYHELFHCVLDRPHYDEELDIMNTYESLENTGQIYVNWDNYVKKVFLRGN